MIEKLRDEIIESQKARTDLMKWKLILVAAIGAAGLGIGSSAPAGSHPPVVVLAFIPLVCLYVDAVCVHNDMRIMAIGRFLRTRPAGSVEGDYERFAKEHRERFSIEGVALVGTTVVLSVLLFFLGSSDIFQKLNLGGDDFARRILMGAGGLGALGGALFYGFHQYWSRKLDTNPKTPSSRSSRRDT